MRYYRRAVLYFPPTAAVTVTYNGQSVRSYNGAISSEGRVYVPVRPYITRLADRVWFDGDTLVMLRGGHTTRVHVRSHHPDALDEVYVPLRLVASALGANVQYVSRAEIAVTMPPSQKPETPAPFDASVPQVTPHAVFTPIPVPTPRPVWTGAPLPRRTPLPFSSPKPVPSSSASSH